MSNSNNHANHRRGKGRDRALLLLLAVISLLAGVTFTRGDDRVRADLLFQVSPPTETPDPNSPLPSPTFTVTPFPSDTPTESLPAPDATATPPLPADTPPPPVDATPVAPTAAPPPLETATATAPAPLLVVPLATPAAPVTATVAGETPPPTPTVRALVILPAEPTASTPERRIDPALFIDNLVIAFGYVWICLGALALVIAALGAVLLLRRPQRPASAAAPSAPSRPAPSAAPPPPPPPPAPGRVAARHRRRSTDEFDQ